MKFTRVRINNFYNLEDVDLDLTQGQALIVGPNGSGKSNIIKCIEFLVNRILGGDPPSGDIWNVNASKSSIEVRAVFSKEEVEFFSKLRLFYLICDVCEMIRFICAVVKSLVSSEFHPECNGASVKKLVDELVKQLKKTFCRFPRKTLTSMFKGEFFGRMDGQERFAVDANSQVGVSSDVPYVEALILDTIKELFPKLLAKTQEAMASEQTRPANRGPDLLMSVRNADTGIPDELQSCCKMYEINSCDYWSTVCYIMFVTYLQLDDLQSSNIISIASFSSGNSLWLPKSKEDDDIGKVLKQIFGDLKKLNGIFNEGNV